MYVWRGLEVEVVVVTCAAEAALVVNGNGGVLL